MSGTEIVITAAGCVTDRGCGSHRSGMRPWPGGPRAAGDGSLPAGATWASLFATPCPRFGRMDPLCRIGLAAVELMGVDFPGMTAAERDAMGVCLGTLAGSLSVDVAFWKSIANPGGPAPALFTYTLPSTLIGEVCIRYGLKGPNLCLMLSPSDSGRLLRETAGWLQRGEASAGLCLFADAVDRDAAPAGEATGAGRAGAFACALLLERRGEAERRGRSDLCAAPGEDGDTRRLCESLCGAGA